MKIQINKFLPIVILPTSCASEHTTAPLAMLKVLEGNQRKSGMDKSG